MTHESPSKGAQALFGAHVVRAACAMAFVFIATSACTRLLFFMYFPEDFMFSASNLLRVAASGLINDLAALTFMLLPATLFLSVLPSKFVMKKYGRVITLVFLWLFTGLVVFSACAEFCFWDEFHSRFNFIAMDYLIYTSEVINNIRESYPIRPILFGVALASCLITAAAWRWIMRVPQVEPTPLTRRLGIAAGNVLLAVLAFFLFTPLTSGSSRYWQEASHNGIYELFSAFRHNTIDYRAFYPLMEKKDAFRLMREELAEPAASFLDLAAGDLRRDITASTPQSAPNVIIVIMESMGSKSFGKYTPNLARLAGEGLFFPNMQSTGTRTVRGLEAVTLSIPPTPGNSIVRRPNNSELFSVGSVFGEKQYDRAFIYGGYGYFDNMNAFFAGNGYRVLDRTDFPAQYKTFATAWGQCDEDLFNISLAEADAVHAAGRPFHQVVLTTSNHRPFTYPNNKIDIPSGTSRRGAVKYADYAIGCFIEAAKKKPWFTNTVFVFVGDHPASVAGKTEIPADAYGVVSIVYAPKLVEPKHVGTLCSQIDLAPTLFALLGWDYRTQFFGKNILTMPQEKGRAWISTYQLLGLLDLNGLTVLRPASRSGAHADPSKAPLPDPAAESRRKLAIASYQCAYDLFAQGLMTEQAVRSIGTSNHMAANK